MYTLWIKRIEDLNWVERGTFTLKQNAIDEGVNGLDLNKCVSFYVCKEDS